MLSTLIILSSCCEKEGIGSDEVSGKNITFRSTESILPDALFELHNDYILWVFDNYMDSAGIYVSDPVDFMDFASRRWFDFIGEVSDFEDLLMDSDTLILSKPYYVVNDGFTNEDLLEDAGWTSFELDFLYIVLDSVHEAIENEEAEETIQQLFNNGKSRISVIAPTNSLITPVHRCQLINTLTQASFSFSLAYEIDDLYGGSQQWIVPCFFYAVEADIEAMHLFQSFGDLSAPGNMAVVAYASVFSFFDCL